MNRNFSLVSAAAALSMGPLTEALHTDPYARERSMKFGNPLLTTELSGSLGGVTAARARGGRGYFRVRRVPSNPRSTYQATVRAFLAAAASAWASDLTDVQRASWETAAPAGLSGMDAFVQSAFYAFQGGTAYIATAPSPLGYTVTPLVAAPTVDASAHTISAPSTEADAGSWMWYATAPQPTSQLARSNSYRFCGVGDGETTPDTNTRAIPTTHPAYAAAAGQVVYVKLVRYDDATGQVATSQEFRCTVQA